MKVHFFWLTVVVILLNIIFSLSLIFIERKNPTTTWAWLLIFLLLPGIGFIIYIIIGQNFSRQKLFKEKAIIDAYKRKSLKDNYLNISEGKDDGSRYFDLRKMNFNNSGARYTENNEIEIYHNGKDKFNALLKDIKNAKNYIHIQYYIFRKDEIGTEIIEALEKKLKEGVEVKFLVDAMGSHKMTKKSLKRYLELGGKFSNIFPRNTSTYKYTSKL